MHEVGGMLFRPLVRHRRLVGALPAQVHVRTAHAPQLQAAGPADLVELEVPLVARVALVPAPDLHRGARVAHQRRDRRLHAATGDPVRPVGRARGPGATFGRGRGPRIVPLGVEPLRAQRNLAVGAEWAARTREMRIGEEVAKPRVRQVLLDAAARSEEHTSELQSLAYLVCRLLLEKKKKQQESSKYNDVKS